MKKAIVSVTNDLSTDQRVDKVCLFLTKLGFEVILIGRRKRNSLQLEKRQYKTERMLLLFEKGPLFYAEYNIRLFFLLLRTKADILVSNDLDTLLANYIAKFFKRCDLVYDTHEYYTGTPELANRPFVRDIWKRIEKFIFPKLKNVFTVNQSIAYLYKSEYGIELKVARNIPSKSLKEKLNFNIDKEKKKIELGLPLNKKIILLQGAGINIERGAEEAVLAMKYIDETILLIIGDGDIIHLLKKMVKENNLSEKIIFIDKLPYLKLLEYTILADIGLTLDKDTNINYRYSLPNKLFDYIYCEVPVLASSLIEIKNIIEKYNIGEIIESHEPQHISLKIKGMINDKDKLKKWKENLKIASNELCWENEEKELLKVYSQYA
ncbi:MAG: glycosyltransferase [Bacteroidales bacterium]|nr:glycosyltransferase [Bacteroidales bacterium]